MLKELEGDWCDWAKRLSHVQDLFLSNPLPGTQGSGTSGSIWKEETENLVKLLNCHGNSSLSNFPKHEPCSASHEIMWYGKA